MARQFGQLITVWFVAAAAGASLFGQAPTTPAPPERKSWLGQKRHGKSADSPEFDNARKAIEGLAPDQRKRFQENFKRWSNLSPEEKKALRDRDEIRRGRLNQEIEAALKQAGLELDKERREQFGKRYGEERRKLEEQLRREMEEKRRPLVEELVGRLKAEFSAPAPPPTPAPPPAAAPPGSSP